MFLAGNNLDWILWGICSGISTPEKPKTIRKKTPGKEALGGFSRLRILRGGCSARETIIRETGK
jgi:hypothetical protein